VHIDTCLQHAQLQVLEYDVESRAIAVRSVHAHAAEVWHIAPCPTDTALATTVYNEGEPAPGRLVLFLAAARRPEACTAGV